MKIKASVVVVLDSNSGELLECYTILSHDDIVMQGRYKGLPAVESVRKHFYNKCREINNKLMPYEQVKQLTGNPQDAEAYMLDDRYYRYGKYTISYRETPLIV